jgi:hypothetical protein
MIVLDAIALATTAFMLLAGGFGLFAPPRQKKPEGRHDRTALVRSWNRR